MSLKPLKLFPEKESFPGWAHLDEHVVVVARAPAAPQRRRHDVLTFVPKIIEGAVSYELGAPVARCVLGRAFKTSWVDAPGLAHRRGLHDCALKPTTTTMATPILNFAAQTIEI